MSGSEKINSLLNLRRLLRHYYEWEAQTGDCMELMYEGPPTLEGREHRLRQAAVRRMLKPERGHKTLDVGCGEGHYVKSLFRSGSIAVGMDISIGKLIRARGRAGNGPAFTQGDALELPFKTATFHWVVLSEVAEHLPDPRGSLKEIARVIGEGGHAVISIPTWDGGAKAGIGVVEDGASIARVVESQFGRPFEGHLWSFSGERFRELLNESGLAPLIETPVRVFMPRWWREMSAHIPVWLWRWLQNVADLTAGRWDITGGKARYLVYLTRRMGA
ncbi:MAG: methyltransferase domain-containing protein [Nitrospinae bacterium]|nr:methyltransferase domain-containing protein [Nitrospinota bacterium]